VVTVFVLVLVLIILYNRHRHKELSETAKDREDIQKGVVKLAERLVLIDLKEWRYRCMDDTYVAEHETCDGSFTKLIDALQRMVVGDEAKKEVGRLYHREYIESLLPLGCDDVRFEYQLNRSNKFTWEDISLVCVGRSKEGIPLRLVYITQDVTELKQREKQMQKAMEDSYRAAVTANNAKSDFLSRMSHDIRTPMNAIIGMTELARMYEGDWKKVDDCLSKITLSSNHLLALINEVLDLSMIENGRLVLNEAEVDLHATFEEVETVFAQRCEEAGIVLVFETKNIRHYWVVVDDLRLQQVFINLVGNAVKFTPRGGRVEVKVRELPTRVGHSSDYEITVADTGCGMSAEFVKHAFEPFEREHDSRVESVEGTGLGLSIVYSIVQLLGGTIEVESEPGVGTTFTIRITLHYLDKLAQATPVLGESVASEDEEEVPVEGPAPLKSAQASEATEEEMHEKARELLQDKRVLLVEDNALNSEIAAALLKTLGLHVEVAENGQEALDLLEASEPQHFDAVLMDVQMPIMNGLEATRALRQSERADLCDLPVIVLSANAFAEDILESKRAGANDHLSKPISIQSISAALVRILEERAHAQC
jgi:signal transduction histidine kinase/CheY-like chemotaxis protein